MTRFYKELPLFHKTINKKELELKEIELKIKEKELNSSKSKWTAPQITLITTIIGLIVTVSLSIYQQFSKLELEKLKFESNLITKVITPNDIEQSKKNLNFLIDLGLVIERKDSLIKALKDPDFNIRIQNELDKFSAYTIVMDESTKAPLPNILVTLEIDSLNIERRTNRNGIASFTGLPSILRTKRVKYSVRERGYIKTSFSTYFLDKPQKIRLKELSPEMKKYLNE
ncbi:hypothetical protein [uncultured Croceitalea sp.]|uniref:hypothetical protein n=1 Tax=uncultured Croceitalea sp. TaxID=1798908 RepID=UPI00374F0F56